MIGEAGVELAGKMVGNVKCYRAGVGLKNTVFTPNGLFVHEAAVNREDIRGIRWSRVLSKH